MIYKCTKCNGELIEIGSNEEDKEIYKDLYICKNLDCYQRHWISPSGLMKPISKQEFMRLIFSRKNLKDVTINKLEWQKGVIYV